MAVPILEFNMGDWLDIPPASGFIELSLNALPPVAASVGIVIFAKPTKPPAGVADKWSQIGKTLIDNLANTAPGQKLRLVIDQRMDYVLRFQGEAHLLMPGFQDIDVSFDLLAQTAPITNFGGKKTATKARAAAINGIAFLRNG